MPFCEYCGKEISEQATVCPNCGHPRQLAQPAQYTAGGAPVSITGQPLSEWWKRLVAILIDGVILWIPSQVLSGIFFASWFDRDPDDLAETTVFTASFLGLSLGAAVIGFLYYMFLNGSERGQTVGKMALKIQVRDIDTGGPIGYGRAAIRALIPAILSAFTCGLLWLIDGLWPLWDPQRQALHDKMARSVVVDVPS